MKKPFPQPRESAPAWPLKYELRRSFGLAGLSMLVVGAMGLVYGIFGGVFLGPALFAITLMGVFVILNAPFALIAAVVQFVLWLTKKARKGLAVYLLWSSAFLVTYMLFFVLLKASGVRPF